MAGPQRANSLLKYSFSWPIGGVASCVFPVVRNASNPLYWDYFNRLLGGLGFRGVSELSRAGDWNRRGGWFWGFLIRLGRSRGAVAQAVAAAREGDDLGAVHKAIELDPASQPQR